MRPLYECSFPALHPSDRALGLEPLPGPRRLVTGIAALVLAAAGAAWGAPVGNLVDVLGNLSSSDFATYIAPQSYRDWGNEPCVAVNPIDPHQVVLSSFGYASWEPSTSAQLWYSTNSGTNWSIEFAVPTPYPGFQYFVDDQVYAYDAAGVLHGAVLGYSGAADYVWHGFTTNVTDAFAWQWDSAALTGPDADQPWMALSGNSLAIGYVNFDAAYTYSEERVALSTNNAQTFPAVLDQAVASPGQVNTGIVNPGLRVAADALGDFFIICGVHTNNDAYGVPLINYRLNRYSGGPGWDFTTASADRIGGLALTNGPSRQGNNSAYSFAGINFLLGNITAIAANTYGSRVYVVFGLSDSSGIGHLYLLTLRTNGATLIRNSAPLLLSATNYTAALPAVAVATNGAVAVLYDQYDGTNVQVHFALSRDDGASIAVDTELYRFNTNGLASAYGLNASHNRWLGDYDRIITLGNTFYASFAGRGKVSGGSNITTNMVVPFFFSFDATVAPPSVLSIARPTPGTARIDFAGTVGATYYVQASTNLLSPMSWQTVSTNVASSTGGWSYTDSTTNWPQRFYRAFHQ